MSVESEVLLRLFNACLDRDYREVENGGSFSTLHDGGILYVFFEKSNGEVDWQNNLGYHSVRYPRAGESWFCHEGFLRVWESILLHISRDIDEASDGVVCVGYSHGAALALLFPNWTEMPVWNFFHIHSFTIHILLVLYPLLLVTTGQAQTDLKSALKGVGLLVVMAIPVYGLNLLWDTNFMFLMHPDSGNPLEMFEKLLGSHLWGFPILLPIVILLMYLPVFLVQKLKKPVKVQ
jgi:hypothetical protein